ELDYGKQYAFSVVAVNDINASSKASAPLSNSVVPYNKPGAVKGLRGATVQSAQGTVQASWQAGVDNGRPITGYEITVIFKDGTKKNLKNAANDLTVDINGIPDGDTVTIEVVAVNAAGQSPK